MICDRCLKLSNLFTKRNCKKCKAEIYSNIAVLCNNCSNIDKVCAICLKKIVNHNSLRTCGKCGNKK